MYISGTVDVPLYQFKILNQQLSQAEELRHETLRTWTKTAQQEKCIGKNFVVHIMARACNHFPLCMHSDFDHMCCL